MKNRIIKVGTITNYADENGFVTQRLIEHYRTIAKGGASLVIVEMTNVRDPDGKRNRYQLSIDGEQFVDGLSRLSKTIKSEGAVALIQLGHAGRAAHSHLTGTRPVAPSPIPFPGYEIPRELPIDEIEELEERFVSGARRAIKAGFDGVELHYAHWYLIASFLSPWSNKRTDAYGGDFARRLRMAEEILKKVRRRLRRGVIISCRINGEEGFDGGLRLRDCTRIARYLEKYGADMLNVSTLGAAVRYGAFPRFSIAPLRMPRGFDLHLSSAVKRVVKVPVVACHRIADPRQANEIVSNGKGDLIGLARALLADPNFPAKALSGRESQIRPCIACNRGCMGRVLSDQAIDCDVNPYLGREWKVRITKSSRKKKVLVLGGGPAGMEAAKTCVLRGHDVILYEKRNQLGGQVLFASKTPGKEELKEMINHQEEEIRALGVDVRLAKVVTRGAIQDLSPDVLVNATGPELLTPKIVNADPRLFLSIPQVFEDGERVGKEVVVLGGNLNQCETAVYLASRGKRVTLIEVGNRIAYDEVMGPREFLLDALTKYHIKILTCTYVERMSGGELHLLTDNYTKPLRIKVGSIVTGYSQSSKNLAEELGFTGPAYSVGDALKPGNIGEAIHSGFGTGLGI